MGTPVLPEVDVEPLGDLMLNFLIERDKEESFVDFKQTLSIARNAPFAKIAKDIFAFSNYGGGFVLIGFREKLKTGTISEQYEEKRSFVPVGLPEDFHIDPSDLQEKFNSYSNIPIQLQYREFFRDIDGDSKKFAAIYVPPSTSILRPIKTGWYQDEKRINRKAFGVGAVLFRRGTQSVVATKQEKEWIRRRAEQEGYRLSALSGQPDQINETLYSNLFEVNKISKIIFTASPRTPSSPRPYRLKNATYDAVYVFWNNRIITFDDISKPESPLWDTTEPSSVQMESLATWLADEDKQRVIIYLLNKELRFLAKKLGLLQEPKKQKFYYPCDTEFRTENWAPRFRVSSTLKVAQRMWAQQLKRFIFWHLAVTARFMYLGNRVFLGLTPTLQITDDGREAIFGSREGTVITRLTYNRYNSSYLNQIFFWIYRFAEGRENIELGQGKIQISARPVETKINVGIMSDRPAAEPVQEIPEIEIIEQE